MRNFSNILIILSIVFTFSGLSECKPSEVQIHMNEGHKLYKQGKYKEAIAEYQQVTTLDPKREDAWKFMGYAYLEMKDIDQAIESMNRLVDLKQDPKDKLDIYKKMADMSAKMGSLRKSISIHEEILKLTPDDRSSVAWIGVLYGKLGGVGDTQSPGNPEVLAQSIEFLDKAIEMNPDDKNVYIHQRTSYAKLIEITKKELEEAKKLKDKKAVAELEKKLEEYGIKMEELGKKWTELTKKEKELEAQKATENPSGEKPPEGASEQKSPEGASEQKSPEK